MNKIDKQNLIFEYFRENEFKNEGAHSYNLNLMFEFSDWIDSDEGREKIAEVFGVDEEDPLIYDIRCSFSRGINQAINSEKSNSWPFLN